MSFYLIGHTEPKTFLGPDFFFQPIHLLLVSLLLHFWPSLLPPAAGPGPSFRDEAEGELECGTVDSWLWHGPSVSWEAPGDWEVPSGWPCVLCLLSSHLPI